MAVKGHRSIRYASAMKKLFCLIFLTSCVRLNPIDLCCDGGTLCQGSRAWKEKNVCGQDNASGYCIEAVRGPITLTEIRSSEHCNNALSVAIKDTWGESTPRWELKGQANTPLVIKDSNLEIRAGESLFIGTDGFNNKVDSSRCYVTWINKR